MMIELAPMVGNAEIQASLDPHATGICPACSWKAIGDDCCWEIGATRSRAEALKLHILQQHTTPGHQPTQLARRLMEEAKKDSSDEYKVLKKEQQRRNVEGCDFWRLRSVGPKRKGKKKYAERYWCRICKVSYSTSYGAMVQHDQEHKKQDPAKVYRVVEFGSKKQSSPGPSISGIKYRPEQHAIHPRTGSHYPGPGVRLDSFRIPDELRWKWKAKDYLRCLNCKKWKIEFQDAEMSMQARAKRIDLYRSHKEKCIKKVRK
ncbi:unnamed protein product [Amoebophrya sp. A25]|nr:unnamed protein product [Amoebophrya sp. A25]|eukprot:GSA25T00010444001.1